MDNPYDRMRNESDMLSGCTKRIIITNDKQELENMRNWAHKYIDSIYNMKKEIMK
jgi:hypothetical protein